MTTKNQVFDIMIDPFEFEEEKKKKEENIIELNKKQSQIKNNLEAIIVEYASLNDKVASAR